MSLGALAFLDNIRVMISVPAGDTAFLLRSFRPSYVSEQFWSVLRKRRGPAGDKTGTRKPRGGNALWLAGPLE